LYEGIGTVCSDITASAFSQDLLIQVSAGTSSIFAGNRFAFVRAVGNAIEIDLPTHLGEMSKGWGTMKPSIWRWLFVDQDELELVQEQVRRDGEDRRSVHPKV
jgi:hypothetical protein